MKSTKYAMYAKKGFAMIKNKKKCQRSLSLQWKIQRSECNLRYKVPKEILVVFHNGSTYDYHFKILGI